MAVPVGNFTAAQTKQLLAPIREQRVLRDGKGNSHVSQQDVTAHLIRVFGFGNFTTELLHVEQVFETLRPTSQVGTAKVRGTDYDLKDMPHLWRYDVAYRAIMRLTIFNQSHEPICSYEDASTGEAQNQVRHEAHDLALKSAISLAKKRCAINLGDQFGLSLYNKGQLAALVGGTHVVPRELREEWEKASNDTEAKDLQEGVPEQVSMGHDEVEKATEVDEAAEEMLAKSLGATPVEESGR